MLVILAVVTAATCNTNGFNKPEYKKNKYPFGKPWYNLLRPGGGKFNMCTAFPESLLCKSKPGPKCNLAENGGPCPGELGCRTLLK